MPRRKDADPKWLRIESWQLDREARSYRARHHVPPLKPDPRLQELLSQPTRPRVEIPECCVACGVRMRSQKAPAVKFPGTVRHSGNGFCDTCATRKRLGKPLERGRRSGR